MKSRVHWIAADQGPTRSSPSVSPAQQQAATACPQNSRPNPLANPPIERGRCGEWLVCLLLRGLGVLSAVALSGCLAGGAEHATDYGPGHAGIAGCGDRFRDATLGGGALSDRVTDGMQGRSISRNLGCRTAVVAVAGSREVFSSRPSARRCAHERAARRVRTPDVLLTSKISPPPARRPDPARR
jgi:hypothetical protein